MSPSKAALDTSIAVWWTTVVVAPLVTPTAMAVAHRVRGKAAMWGLLAMFVLVASAYQVWWWRWSFSSESPRSPLAYVVSVLLFLGVPSLVAGSTIAGRIQAWSATRFHMRIGVVSAIAAAYLTLAVIFFPAAWVFFMVYRLTGGFI